MGDNPLYDRLAELYGLDTNVGYVPPGVRSHPAVAPDAQEHPIARWLRDMAGAVPHVPQRSQPPETAGELAASFGRHVADMPSGMAEGALRGMANWGEGRPQTQDMLTPTWAAAMANPVVRMGHLGRPMEHPTQAALRTNGRVFTGRIHADAALEAEKSLGDRAWRSPEEGFITNEGRFVSRQEARDLQNQSVAPLPPVRHGNRTFDAGELDWSKSSHNDAKLPSAKTENSTLLFADPNASNLPGTLVPQPREEGDLAALLERYYSVP